MAYLEPDITLSPALSFSCVSLIYMTDLTTNGIGIALRCGSQVCSRMNYVQHAAEKNRLHIFERKDAHFLAMTKNAKTTAKHSSSHCQLILSRASCSRNSVSSRSFKGRVAAKKACLSDCFSNRLTKGGFYKCCSII